MEHVNHSDSDQNVYDMISQDDVEGRFGGSLIDDLIGDHQLLGVAERPYDEEFTWWINDSGDLKAIFHGRTFVHDDDCDNGAWEEVIP